MAGAAKVDIIPELNPERAADALAFHREIREALEEHSNLPDYREQGYVIKPIAGIFQPARQSMVIRDRDIQILRTYEGHDEGGAAERIGDADRALQSGPRNLCSRAPRILAECRPLARPNDRSVAATGDRPDTALRALGRGSASTLTTCTWPANR
jgi:hypothetical protein